MSAILNSQQFCCYCGDKYTLKDSNTIKFNCKSGHTVHKTCYPAILHNLVGCPGCLYEVPATLNIYKFKIK
jgi:hypothetical protein